MNADSFLDPPEPSREWEALAYCAPCDADTENRFLEWRESGHIVTRECGTCGDVFEIEDDE